MFSCIFFPLKTNDLFHSFGFVKIDKKRSCILILNLYVMNLLRNDHRENTTPIRHKSLI